VTLLRPKRETKAWNQLSTKPHSIRHNGFLSIPHPANIPSGNNIMVGVACTVVSNPISVDNRQ